jgi:hypothetical protein
MNYYIESGSRLTLEVRKLQKSSSSYSLLDSVHRAVLWTWTLGLIQLPKRNVLCSEHGAADEVWMTNCTAPPSEPLFVLHTSRFYFYWVVWGGGNCNVSGDNFMLYCNILRIKL